MKRLTLPLIALLACSGCAAFRPAVPTTKFTVWLGNHKASFSGPKNTDASKLLFEVATNGTMRFSVDHLSATNDANVIDKAAAGQAALIQATGNAIAQGVQAGAAAAGAALGAAAKAP